MSEDFEDEITSINAIYDKEVLQKVGTSAVLLDVPGALVRLRMNVPTSYPKMIPTIEGPDASAASLKKGQASKFATHAKNVLQRSFREGEPCMFDLIEELKEYSIVDPTEMDTPDPASIPKIQQHAEPAPLPCAEDAACLETTTVPDWTLSEVVTEKKSIFIARTVQVSGPTTAKAYVQHLLTTDKKSAKADHNITAWRVKDDSTGIVYRDCDDDGETAAGSRLLHLLELMNVWNVMIIVTRWYGGVHLGPDRFRIINSVARDAIVKAGFVVANQMEGKRK